MQRDRSLCFTKTNLCTCVSSSHFCCEPKTAPLKSLEMTHTHTHTHKKRQVIQMCKQWRIRTNSRKAEEMLSLASTHKCKFLKNGSPGVSICQLSRGPRQRHLRCHLFLKFNCHIVIWTPHVQLKYKEMCGDTKHQIWGLITSGTVRRKGGGDHRVNSGNCIHTDVISFLKLNSEDRVHWIILYT